MCKSQLALPNRVSLSQLKTKTAALAGAVAWFAAVAIWAIAGAPLTAAADNQECPSPERHTISTRVPLMRNMVNPNPYDDDIELPLPCQGKLIFRLVCVPASGYLDDFDFQAGCPDCGRQTDGYMEEKRTVALAGAFTIDDLPESWRPTAAQMMATVDGWTAPPGGPQAASIYLISKYEITNFQWDAVMKAECPGWDRLLTNEDARPKTNISWFEAVEFTRRLTEWLLQNSPEALPTFSDGRVGYVRLPTEIEWEFAARGGHRVSPAELNQEAFFPLKNRDLSEYAIYTESTASKPPEKLAWIGTRCGNPLGLFDTAGNASEMVLDPFRFSIDGGLHGGAGGFLIKGGSYLKSTPEIMPGRREEMPYYLENGAFRSHDLGFRVVLSGIATSRERVTDLKEQFAEKIREKAIRDFLKDTRDPAAAASAAASAADGTPDISADIWKALFTLESLANHYASNRTLREEIENVQTLAKTSLPESEINQLAEQKQKLNERIQQGEAALQELLQSYLRTVLKIRTVPEKVRAQQIDALSQDPAYQTAGRLSLASRLTVIRGHLENFSRNDLPSQSRQILDDVAAMASVAPQPIGDVGETGHLQQKGIPLR